MTQNGLKLETHVFEKCNKEQSWPPPPKCKGKIISSIFTQFYHAFDNCLDYQNNILESEKDPRTWAWTTRCINSEWPWGLRAFRFVLYNMSILILFKETKNYFSSKVDNLHSTDDWESSEEPHGSSYCW